METKSTSFRLPKKDLELLKKISEVEDRSATSVLRTLIRRRARQIFKPGNMNHSSPLPAEPNSEAIFALTAGL